MQRTVSPTVVRFVDALWHAEVERAPIEPLSDSRRDLSIADAYAIQSHNVDRRVAAGAVIRGRKVGLTSRASQDLLGVREPNFGMLLDDMFVDEGDEIPFDALLQPRVEAEIAFVMATDLAGPGVTATDALTAIAGVLPAIEVVDSRIADWCFQLVDTVADNASVTRAVIGTRITPVAALDLRLIGVLFHRNGASIDSGAGSGRPGQPRALRRLARQPARLAGRLPAGGRHRAARCAAPRGARPSRRLLPRDVRPSGHGHRALRQGGPVTNPRPIADVLIEAENTRTPVPPVTRRNPFLDIETAYKAQAMVVDHRVQGGERVVGAKLAFTSAVKRHAMGIHEPAYGRLTSGMVLPFGEAARLDERIHPRAEPEIAFVIGRRIAGVVTVAEVLQATEAFLPAVEIVDTRYSSSFRLPDAVADNVGSARVAVGACPRRPADLEDLSVLGCVFRSRSGIDTAACRRRRGDGASGGGRRLAGQGARGARRGARRGISGPVRRADDSVPLEPHGLVVAEFDGLGPFAVRCV
jgi:2-keto-4-pentenoate hydratase